MAGLIFKDLINCRKYAKTLSIVFIIWCVIFIPQGSISFLAGLTCILTVMMAVSSMAYDESAQWERLALTMPLSRRDLVLSKYLLAGLLGGIGSLLALLISLICSLFMSVDLGEALLTTAVCFLISLIYAAIVLPFIYKLGVEKARLVMLLAFLAPYGLLMLVGDVIQVDLSFFSTLSPALLVVLAVLVVVAAFLLSFRVSLGIFAKKDL